MVEDVVIAESVVVVDLSDEGGRVEGWTGEGAEDVDDETPSTDQAAQQSNGTAVQPLDDSVKRPRRRRGRRGGRRNRPGGNRGTGNPPDGSPPPPPPSPPSNGN